MKLLRVKNAKRVRLQRGARNQGMSLPEVTITLGVFGILASLAAPALTLGTNPLSDSMNLVEGNIKMARSKAMSQTKAYRIKPTASRQFIMEKHAASAGSSIFSCDDAADNSAGVWETATGFNTNEDMALQDGVRVKSVNIDGVEASNLTDWELCFDARGMANKNVVITLEEEDSGETKMLEIFSGGSMVAYDSVRYNTGASSPSGSPTIVAATGIVGAGGESGSISTSPDESSDSDPTKSNNGHGNNCDGVDVSNPGQGRGGPNNQIDASGEVDDECN